jgi:hypothetical protein
MMQTGFGLCTQDGCPLGESHPCECVIVRSDVDNRDYIIVGNTFVLGPGESTPIIDCDDVSEIDVVSLSGHCGFSFIYT